MRRSHRRVITAIVIGAFLFWICAVTFVGIEYTRSQDRGQQAMRLELTDIAATIQAR